MNTDDSVTGPINVGNPSEFTMLELAEKVLTLARSNSPIVKNPLPGDDPKQRRPDITLAKKLLNWEPKMDIDEGIKRTIKYFEGII
jgi:UDP-glucuronate decarboxylase